jgi:hypothetical protein
MCDFSSQVIWTDVHTNNPHSVHGDETIQRDFSAVSRQLLHCTTRIFSDDASLETEMGTSVPSFKIRYIKKGKVISLNAMEVLWVRGGIALTLS